MEADKNVMLSGKFFSGTPCINMTRLYLPKEAA